MTYCKGNDPSYILKNFNAVRFLYSESFQKYNSSHETFLWFGLSKTFLLKKDKYITFSTVK